MNKIILYTCLAALTGFVSCKTPDSTLPITFIETTFEKGAEDWTGDFAFYKKDLETAVAFSMKQERLPTPLDSTLHALKVEGTNSGDSLFLFIKKKVSGLDPAKTYKVAYRINLATSYPDTLLAAGRLIYVKAGAATDEPVKVLATNIYKVSIKNGALAKSGTEMFLLGNMANTLDSTAYKNIIRDNANLAVEVKPNAAGDMWLCVGVNTAYKGKITVFIDKIYVAISEKPVN